MGNRIRQLREERHMTQVRLSVELEVSQETISAYETEKHFPSYVQLRKLSSFFHASIDYVMGCSEVRNPVSGTESEDLKQLVHLGKRLTEKQLKLVLAYMQGIIDMAEKE